jgi:hypothetical protein
VTRIHGPSEQHVLDVEAIVLGGQPPQAGAPPSN